MKKCCQSCARILKQGKLDCRGTNKDGSRTNEYCTQCYLNGVFLNENLTVDKLIEDYTNQIQQSSLNRFSKFVYLKSYPILLKRLKRWR